MGVPHRHDQQGQPTHTEPESKKPKRPLARALAFVPFLGAGAAWCQQPEMVRVPRVEARRVGRRGALHHYQNDRRYQQGA